MSSLAINNTSYYVSSLLSAGADAMKNMYYIEFGGSSSVLESALGSQYNALTIRSTDFTPPTVSQTTKSISYLTTSIDVPTAGMNLDRSFSISFRLDANYNVYKTLKFFQELTSKPTLGFAGTALPSEIDQELTVTVYSLSNVIVSDSQLVMDSNRDAYFNNDALNGNNKKLLYSFHQCWVDKVSIDGTYSYGSANQMTVTASFQFGEMKTPTTTLQSNT